MIRPPKIDNKFKILAHGHPNLRFPPVTRPYPSIFLVSSCKVTAGPCIIKEVSHSIYRFQPQCVSRIILFYDFY